MNGEIRISMPLKSYKDRDRKVKKYEHKIEALKQELAQWQEFAEYLHRTGEVENILFHSRSPSDIAKFKVLEGLR